MHCTIYLPSAEQLRLMDVRPPEPPPLLCCCMYVLFYMQALVQLELRRDCIVKMLESMILLGDPFSIFFCILDKETALLLRNKVVWIMPTKGTTQQQNSFGFAYVMEFLIERAELYWQHKNKLVLVMPV